LSQAEQSLFDTIEVLEKEAMSSWLAEAPAGPVVVDTCTIPRLAFVADPLCLVLRETTAERIGDFRLDAGRRWDAIIVPSPASHWRFDPAALPAGRIAHVNWIVRPTEAALAGHALLPASEAPRLVVATGGGGTTATAAVLKDLVDPVLAGVKSSVPHVDIIQVAGPRLPVAGRMAHADRLVDVGSRLNEVFAQADAVITTVGYNSVLELAGLTTPTLLVPIDRTFDDQARRAAQWAERLGLAHDDQVPTRSVSWLVSILSQRQRRAAVALGPSGCTAAAELILDLARTPESAWGFQKPAAFSDAVATRATAAFRSGVATPCARPGDGHIVMPLLPAPTLRGRLHEAGGPFCDADALGEALVRQIGAATLAPMRVAEALGLSLKPFAPLAKVKTRLDQSGAFRRRAIDLALACETAIEGCPARTRQGSVLHGDLHVGQILVERQGDTTVLDLDDLCIGDPEADLANFCAHLVTSPDLYDGPVATGYVRLSRALAVCLAEASPCMARLDAYGSAALLRRALKIAGTDAPRQRVNRILDAVEILLGQQTDEAVVTIPASPISPRHIESGV
jgi:hypothetical protein